MVSDERHGLTNGEVMEKIQQQSLGGLTRGYTNGAGKGQPQKGVQAGFVNGAGKGLTNGAGKGLTNGAGKGLTNGAGKGLTNGAGKGLTNGAGKGFTNGAGSGLTNGAGKGCNSGASSGGFVNGACKEGGNLYHSRQPFHFRKTRVYSAWKTADKNPNFRPALAILCVALIVATVPQAVLQFVENIPKISIDGFFGDWNGITKTADRIADVKDASVDITQAATYVEKGDTNIYVATSGATMFKGAETPTTYVMDTLLVFFDTDKNADTGYQTAMGNGAEYMVRISGYNMHICKAIVYKFDGAAKRNDWGGWKNAGDIHPAMSATSLEARIDGMELKQAIVEEYFIAADGTMDTLDKCIVKTDAAILNATTLSYSYQALQLASTPLFQMQLSSSNGASTISSVYVNVDGTAPSSSTGEIKVWMRSGTGKYVFDYPHNGQARLDIGEIIPANRSMNYDVGVALRGQDLIGKTLRLTLKSGNSIKTDAIVLLDTLNMSKKYNYIVQAPQGVVIDGGFDDWLAGKGVTGNGMTDKNPNVEIQQVKMFEDCVYIETYGTILGGAPFKLDDVVVGKEAQPNVTNLPANVTQELNATSEIRNQAQNLSTMMTDTITITLDNKSMIVIEGTNGDVISSKLYQKSNRSWQFISYVDAMCSLNQLEFKLPIKYVWMRIDVFDFNRRGDSITLKYYDALPVTDDGSPTPPSTDSASPSTPDALATLQVLNEGWGNNKTNKYGYNVTSAGDLNKDGYSDIAISCPYWNYSARGFCGAVFIFFGYAKFSEHYSNYANWSKANVTIYGAAAGNHFGWSSRGMGSMRNDGYADLIVGAPDTSKGNAYIFYGKGINWRSKQASHVWDLNSVSANVTLTGDTAGDQFGYSVSGAGDINADGYKDVIVGAPSNSTWGWSGTSYNDKRGAAYILNGSATPSATYTASTMGIKMYGVMSENFGSSVTSTGDYNKDGKDEVMVTAKGFADNMGSTNTGAVMMFGRETGGYSINQNQYSCGFENSAGVNQNGWYSSGTTSIYSTDKHSGTYCCRISGGGGYVRKRFSYDNIAINQLTFWWKDQSVTADMHMDVEDYGIVHPEVATQADGSSTWLKVTVNMYRFNTSVFRLRFYTDDASSIHRMLLDDVNITGIKSTRIIGEAGSNYFGSSLDNATDLNSDGFADVLLGARGYNSNQGRVYVYRGSAFTQPTQRTDYNQGEFVDMSASQAQAFKVNVGIVLWAVSLKVSDTGTDSATMSVNVQTDNAGKPSGTIITNTVTQDFPASIAQFQRVQFSTNPTLTAGTKYWIVATNGDVYGNGYLWAYDENNPYTDGGYSTNGGIGWSAEDTTDIDLTFTVYSMPNCTMTGQTAGDQFGFSVGHCLDFTYPSPDGKPDIIVGAPYYDANDYGRVYVFNGTITGSVAASTAEWSYTGTQANMRMGWSVAGRNLDLNKDGKADIMASAPYWDNGANVDSGYVRIMTRLVPEFDVWMGTIGMLICAIYVFGRRRRCEIEP